MSLIRNLAGFLDDTGVGTVGSYIYLEELPAEPADALMLVSMVSPEPDQYLNTQTLDFAIWSRNKSTKTGSDKLTECFLLLHRYHHLTLGDYHIFFIGALGNIESLGKDIEGRSLAKINFRAIYKDTRTVS